MEQKEGRSTLDERAGDDQKERIEEAVVVVEQMSRSDVEDVELDDL
jgi:hypothetical protein